MDLMATYVPPAIDFSIQKRWVIWKLLRNQHVKHVLVPTGQKIHKYPNLLLFSLYFDDQIKLPGTISLNGKAPLEN